MYYSPVRHSPPGASTRAAVRLACVRHAASVQSEPGSNSSVQFNDSGVSGATSDFTFDKTSKQLRVANNVILGLVGGSEATINSTTYTGTSYSANNASNLGGTAAASYQLNSTLAAIS